MIPLEAFPKINASLNALASVFLILGYVFIRRRAITKHRASMITACTCSLVFLACYVWYHLHAGRTTFQTPGVIRAVYLTVLLTHTVLAVAIVPFVILTLKRALSGNFLGHRRIARVTWPAWIYVSVTGVLIYFFLYHLDPALTPR